MEAETAKKFVIDAYGFIQWATMNIEDYNEVILETITHDILGLAQEEKCFRPQVSGYAKYLTAADKKRLGIK